MPHGFLRRLRASFWSKLRRQRTYAPSLINYSHSSSAAISNPKLIKVRRAYASSAVSRTCRFMNHAQMLFPAQRRQGVFFFDSIGLPSSHGCSPSSGSDDSALRSLTFQMRRSHMPDQGLLRPASEATNPSVTNFTLSPWAEARSDRRWIGDIRTASKGQIRRNHTA